MLIQRMSAVFGRLRNETIDLQSGLNIIEAPNETGKSTWCAFLTAMLYGINSRERDRVGFIAEKNRYAPWDGTTMTGRLDCRVDGRDITLTRDTRRQTAPMAEFQTVYTGTAAPVEELTGANCGETLLGVTREVFERSAFIRQSGLAITQDAGLERRVASLISSGEEDTSYTEAHDALKKQLNRRRFNKSGQLPALEAELHTLQQQIDHAAEIRRQLADAQLQTQAAEQAVSALSDELAQCDRWDAAEKRRQLASLTTAAQEAAQHARTLEQQLEADRVPDSETIGRLRGAIVNLNTTRKAVDKARAERDEAMKVLLKAEAAVSESPFAGQTAEHALKDAAEPPQKVHWNIWPGVLTVILGFSAAFAAFYATAIYTKNQLLSAAVLLVLLAIFSGIAVLLRKKAVQAARNAALFKRFGTSDRAEIATMADTYMKLVEARDAAQAAANARSASADALYSSLTTNEQAILLEVRRFAPAAFDIPTADEVLRHAAQRRRALAEAQTAAREANARQALVSQQPLPEFVEAEMEPPARSRETVSAALTQAQAQLAAARSAADRLSGQLHAMGDPAVLESTAGSLQAQITQLQGEYDALRLAMDTLTDANTTLQNRFSPQLSRRTAEIFQDLTGGRYTGAALDRSFHLTAQPVGDPIDRDIQFLSAGAADQLYLAARLAICQLVLPTEKKVPLILDDALTNFDDERCAAALRWLKKEAEHRQILLFTCHSREAAFFANDSAVSIQKLG